MGRNKTDFENITNRRERGAKDENFEDILKGHKGTVTKGWHKGKFLKVRRKDDYLIATADIFDLEDGTYYGTANGFLPISYSDEDITAEFLEVFDNPSKFSDVIGKEAKVYIAFTEGDNGVKYPNIYGYEKL